MGRGYGAYADLKGLGDNSINTPAERKSSCVNKTVVLLTIFSILAFAACGWFIYGLENKYADFNKKYNGNWSETMQKITDYDGAIKNLQRDVSNIDQNEIPELQKQVTDLSGEVKPEIDTLTANVKTNTGNVATNTANIKNNTETAIEAKGMGIMNKARLDVLEPKAEKNTADVANLTTDTDANKAAIAALTPLTAAVAILTTNMTAVQQQQAAHGITIGDNTAGVKTNKNYAENVLLPPILKNTNDAGTALKQVENLNASLSGFSTDINKAKADITALTANKLSGVTLELTPESGTAAVPTITCTNSAMPIGAACTCKAATGDANGVAGLLTYTGPNVRCVCDAGTLDVFTAFCVKLNPVKP